MLTDVHFTSKCFSRFILPSVCSYYIDLYALASSNAKSVVSLDFLISHKQLILAIFLLYYLLYNKDYYYYYYYYFCIIIFVTLLLCVIIIIIV